MRPIIRKPETLSADELSRNKHNARDRGTNGRHFGNYNDYPKNQSQSASRSQGVRSGKFYSDAVKGSSGENKYFCPTQNTDYLKDQDILNRGKNWHSGYSYAVPTNNRFNSFNQENY